MARREFRPDGSAIRRRRTDLGYANWHALAAECTNRGNGLSGETVKNAEAGRPASRQTLAALASVLGGYWTDYLARFAAPDPADACAANNERALRECEAERAWALTDGVAQMLGWERERPPGLPLEVETLAIDLTNGWSLIETAVLNVVSPAINFRILMLTTDEIGLPADAPHEVRAWSHAGVGYRKVVERRLGEYAARNGPKRLSVEIREYDCVPTTHGIRLAKGDEALFVITRCRPRPEPMPVYDYGDGQYRLFRDPGAAPVLADLRAEYLDLHGRLWGAGEPKLRFEHSPRAGVGPAAVAGE